MNIKQNRFQSSILIPENTFHVCYNTTGYNESMQKFSGSTQQKFISLSSYRVRWESRALSRSPGHGLGSRFTLGALPFLRIVSSAFRVGGHGKHEEGTALTRCRGLEATHVTHGARPRSKGTHTCRPGEAAPSRSLYLGRKGVNSKGQYATSGTSTDTYRGAVLSILFPNASPIHQVMPEILQSFIY